MSASSRWNPRIGVTYTVLNSQIADTLVRERLMAMLFGLEPNDPLTLVGAVAGLATVALTASYAPARRAARIEPNTALRID